MVIFMFDPRFALGFSKGATPIFKRDLLPVWIGITLLSGMFLMGQDSWCPQAGTLADVVKVSVSGDEGAYVFSVRVSSPDTGCSQYADWWELLTPEGELLFRHVLLHSHVCPPSPNPFSRPGGPYPIQSQQTIIVRAHMNNLGYGGAAMRGTVASGFEPAPDITETFAPEVEALDPQPPWCPF
jgi:hypothetical protein